jgi:hypothetical protein
MSPTSYQTAPPRVSSTTPPQREGEAASSHIPPELSNEPSPLGSRNLAHAPCPEAERLHLILRALIALAGYSLKEVERRVTAGGCGFGMAHVLARRQDLKVQQVVAICRAIAVHPAEVFKMALPEPSGPSPLVAEVEALIRPPKADPLRAAVATRLLQSQGIEPERRGRP